jgi:hypothetical protein
MAESDRRRRAIRADLSRHLESARPAALRSQPASEYVEGLWEAPAGLPGKEQPCYLYRMLTSMSSHSSQPLPLPSWPTHSLRMQLLMNATATAGPPAYPLIKVRTVGNVWREYKEGISGGQDVEKLELEWEARRRPEAKQRTVWCRRKVIVDEVLHLIHSGLEPVASVVELEAQCGSQTLPKLHDSLLALQKKRRSVQQCRQDPAGRGMGKATAYKKAPAHSQEPSINCIYCIFRAHEYTFSNA